MLTKPINFLIILSFIIPIQIPLIKFGSKPIDLVFSDIVFVSAIFYLILELLVKNKVYYEKFTRNFTLVVISIILYFIIISIIQFLKTGGNFVSILSAIKLTKPILFILLGIYLSTKPSFVKNFEKYFLLSIVLISIIIFISTILDSRFPYMRWGGNFLTYDIYGFPNSFMNFFAFLSVFMLGKYYASKKKFYLYIY